MKKENYYAIYKIPIKREDECAVYTFYENSLEEAESYIKRIWDIPGNYKLIHWNEGLDDKTTKTIEITEKEKK